MRSLLIFVSTILLFVHINASATEEEPVIDSTWENLVFSIEDSRCFVGFAPVYLTVSTLKPEDGKLVGTYKIEVPIMTSKNDHGKIVLPLNMSVSDLGAKGGVLKGKAHSYIEEGIINDIVCEIFPQKDQSIKLAITTSSRTLKFKSRYSVIESSETSETSHDI